MPFSRIENTDLSIEFSFDIRVISIFLNALPHKRWNKSNLLWVRLLWLYERVAQFLGCPETFGRSVYHSSHRRAIDLAHSVAHLAIFRARDVGNKTASAEFTRRPLASPAASHVLSCNNVYRTEPFGHRTVRWPPRWSEPCCTSAEFNDFFFHANNINFNSHSVYKLLFSK